MSISLDTLREALARPKPKRRALDGMSHNEFADLRHTLSDVQKVVQKCLSKKSAEELDAYRADGISLITSFILECTPRAPWLYKVMEELAALRERLKHDQFLEVLKDLNDVKDLLTSLEGSPRHFVFDLCNEHKGKSFNEPQFQNTDKWSAVDHAKPSSAPLLFDLGELRMAVAALRANANKSDNSSDYCLFYREGSHTDSNKYIYEWAEVTWLEAVPKKANSAESVWADVVDAKDISIAVKNLLHAAGRSLPGKHLYRGLPQVLLFGVENQARSVSVYVGSQWRFLWSLNTSKLHEVSIGAACESFWASKMTNFKATDFSPNYGWRYLFIRRNDRTEISDIISQPNPATEIGEKNEDTGTPITLCDDDSGAKWIPIIKSYLEGQGYNCKVLVPPPNVSSVDALLKAWKNEVAQESIVITDSEFQVGHETAKDGGSQFLNALVVEGKLKRGLVYSEAPRLSECSDSNTPMIVTKKLTKRSPEDDARIIGEFIRTGRLEPLRPLIEMLNRLVATLEHFLNSRGTLPEDWTHIMASSVNAMQSQNSSSLEKFPDLGVEVLNPFLGDSFRLFTEEVGYSAEMSALLKRSCLPDKDIQKFLNSVRGVLCPVDSVVQIHNAGAGIKPWTLDPPIGAIRILCDFIAGVPSPDDTKRVKAWLDSRVKGIVNKDVALKYRSLLTEYYESCLAKLGPEDYIGLVTAVHRQISGLNLFRQQIGETK